MEEDWNDQNITGRGIPSAVQFSIISSFSLGRLTLPDVYNSLGGTAEKN